MEDRLEALREKYHVEVWRSDDNRNEVHIFRPGTPNTYILGFNPTLVQLDVVERVLESLKQ